MSRLTYVHIIVVILFVSQSFVTVLPNAEANMVNTSSTSHQISSQSFYVEFSGASSSTSSGLDEAYDGDSTTGSFARIRTYPCENFNNGPACTSGSYGQVDFSIQTTSPSSSSFTIDFDHQMVAYCSTNPKVMFSIWNYQTTSWLLMDTESSTGGYNLNRTYSGDYMTQGGEITIRWRAESGCSSTGSNEYIISRLYEFHVYAPDTDGDGIPDASDQCANGATGWSSSTGPDHDSDGCHDLVEDNDDDNDGIDDALDYCQTGLLDWISVSINDHDGDGCNDIAEDNDDDNDTVLDAVDSCHFGVLFISDSVSDYDSDGCEDGTEDSDDDNDTISDSLDNCSKGIKNWISDSSKDNDGDGCKDDSEDADDDNDGFNDSVESDCQSDPLDSQSVPTNSDGTGDCDYLDNDDDDDGTPDGEDDFPFDPLEDTDTDEDGIGDNADLDDDWDSFDDTYEESCGSDPLNNTSVPLNFDGDQLCDALDDDDDDDGFNDSIDLFPFNALEWADFDGDGTGDTEDSDDDNDGASDTYEAGCGTLPNDNSSVPGDLDEDGQCDGMDMDDDGDGWSDTLEDSCGFNSMSNASTPPDMDGDGQCDVLDDDIDGDGFTNDQESDCGTNELDNTSLCQDSLPTDPGNQNDTSNSSAGNDDSNGTSDNITNPGDGNEFSDSDSKVEDGDENSFSELLLVLLIVFIIAVVLQLLNKKQANEIAEAEEREKSALNRADEATGRLADFAEKTMESVTKVVEGSQQIAQEALVSTTSPSNEERKEQPIELEVKKAFILESIKFLNHPEYDFSGDILQGIIPYSGDSNRSQKSSDSFTLTVTIRIGMEYYEDIIPDGEDVVEILNKIIADFFKFTGGVLEQKMGGWKDTKEPALELSASMQYVDLYTNLPKIKEICRRACWNFNQEAVFVKIDGPEAKTEFVNPLLDMEKRKIAEQKKDRTPTKFSQSIFEMLDEKEEEIDSDSHTREMC